MADPKNLSSTVRLGRLLWAITCVLVICFSGADLIAKGIMPTNSFWRLALTVMLFLGYLTLIESAFWVWANLVMEMYVVKNVPHGKGNARVTFVKLQDDEFFVPEGQELVIRRSEDGTGVDFFTGKVG